MKHHPKPGYEAMRYDEENDLYVIIDYRDGTLVWTYDFTEFYVSFRGYEARDTAGDDE